MTDKSQYTTQECAKDDLVNSLSPQIDSTKCKEDHKGDAQAWCRHFDNVSSAEDGHTRILNADFMICVKVESCPEEDVAHHMTRWVSKTQHARTLQIFDCVWDPIGTILSVEALKNVLHEVDCRHAAPEI